MRRQAHLLTTVAVAVIGVTGLTGCGDTTADEPAADCAMHPGQTVTVEIPEFTFSPTPVRISACDAVQWKNAHGQAHTSTGNGDLVWSTGNIAAGSTSEAVVFADAGSFEYICALHPFMRGTVEVS